MGQARHIGHAASRTVKSGVQKAARLKTKRRLFNNPHCVLQPQVAVRTWSRLPSGGWTLRSEKI